ncbi:MAG: sigma-70 family RNA polymerase sigma factor [Planctomycetes bacterium]|nr:sigma-70 family RNA polymerase sigma factor [Planctomycetota bacterium]
MNGLDVYEILVREHQAMVLAYVSGIVDDHALVEDVCQEAFIDGFRNLAALRRDESFPAWLRTIARHRALAALRQRNREAVLSPATIAGMEEVFTAIEQTPGVGFSDRVAALRTCVDQLPDAMRDCCRLHYFDGQRTADIAERLGQSLAAVLKRLQRAREVLGDCIGRRLGLEDA